MVVRKDQLPTELAAAIDSQLAAHIKKLLALRPGLDKKPGELLRLAKEQTGLTRKVHWLPGMHAATIDAVTWKGTLYRLPRFKLLVKDVGDRYELLLIQPPKEHLVSQIASIVVSPFTFTAKVIGVGFEKLLELMEYLLCDAAEAEYAKLTRSYASQSRPDYAAYEAAVRSAQTKLCPFKPIAPLLPGRTPPPPPPPKAETPWYKTPWPYVGVGVAAAALGLTLRRRRRPRKR